MPLTSLPFSVIHLSISSHWLVSRLTFCETVKRRQPLVRAAAAADLGEYLMVVAAADIFAADVAVVADDDRTAAVVRSLAVTDHTVAGAVALDTAVADVDADHTAVDRRRAVLGPLKKGKVQKYKQAVVVGLHQAHVTELPHRLIA